MHIFPRGKKKKRKGCQDTAIFELLIALKLQLGMHIAGMMGSGKTTVGRKLAEVLDYSFFDWFVL